MSEQKVTPKSVTMSLARAHKFIERVKMDRDSLYVQLMDLLETKTVKVMPGLKIAPADNTQKIQEVISKYTDLSNVMFLTKAAINSFNPSVGITGLLAKADFYDCSMKLAKTVKMRLHSFGSQELASKDDITATAEFLNDRFSVAEDLGQFANGTTLSYKPFDTEKFNVETQNNIIAQIKKLRDSVIDRIAELNTSSVTFSLPENIAKEYNL